MAALSGGRESVVVTLGDEPLIAPPVVARFADERARHARRTTAGPGIRWCSGREQLAADPSLAGDRGARELLGDARRSSAET